MSMSIHRETDEQDAAHTYNGILLSHKKEKEERHLQQHRLDLETVLLSKASQTQKDKSHMILPTCD